MKMKNKKVFKKIMLFSLYFLIILTILFDALANEVYIDIGTPAIDRSSSQSIGGFTIITQENPANTTGIINSVELYAYVTMSNVEVATFYVQDENMFSTRDYEYIGTVASGSKQTFNVNISVQEGDYIGFYSETGEIERTDDVGSSKEWFVAGDNVPCNSVIFYISKGYYLYSIYGIGIILEEEPEPEPEITGFATVDLNQTSNVIFLFILIFLYLGVMALGFTFKNGGFVSFGFFIGIILGFMLSAVHIFLTFIFMFLNVIIFYSFVKKGK